MSDINNYSEFDRHEGDNEWYSEGEDIYEEILDKLIEDFGSEVIDQHAADLLWAGWFDADETSYERAIDWFEFFEYTGIDQDDFDWDLWREWYES